MVQVLYASLAMADDLSEFIAMLDRSQLRVDSYESDRLPVIMWQSVPNVVTSDPGGDDLSDTARITEMLKRGVWPAAWLGRTDWSNEPVGCTPMALYTGESDPQPCSGQKYYNRFDLSTATRIARAMRLLGYRVPLVMPTIPGAEYNLFRESLKVKAPTSLPNTGGFIYWPSYYQITHQVASREAASRIRHVASSSGGGKDWILGLFADYESMPYESNGAWEAQGDAKIKETYAKYMRPMLPIVDPITQKRSGGIANPNVVVSPPGYSFNTWVGELRDSLLYKIFAAPLREYDANRTALVGNYQTRNTQLNTLLPAVYANDINLAKRYQTRSFARKLDELDLSRETGLTQVTIPLNKYGLSHGLSNGDRVTLLALELPSGVTSISSSINVSVGETYRVVSIPPADPKEPSKELDLYRIGDHQSESDIPIEWVSNVVPSEAQLRVKLLFGRAFRTKVRADLQHGTLRLGDTTPHPYLQGDILTLVDISESCGADVTRSAKGRSFAVEVIDWRDFKVTSIDSDGGLADIFNHQQPPCEPTLFWQLGFPLASPSANRIQISQDQVDRFYFPSLLNRYERFVRQERDDPSTPKRIFPYVSPDVRDDRRCQPNCPWVRMSSRAYKDLLHHMAVRGRVEGFFAFNVFPNNRFPKNVDTALKFSPVLEATQSHIRELLEVTRELHPFRMHIRHGVQIRADIAEENVNRLNAQQRSLVSASRYMDDVLVRVSRFGVRPNSKQSTTGGAVQLRPFPERPDLSFNLWGSPEGNTFLLRPDGSVRCGCGKVAVRPSPTSAWSCNAQTNASCHGEIG